MSTSVNLSEPIFASLRKTHYGIGLIMQQPTTPTNRGADTSLLETQTEGEQGILCLKRADMDHS
jgi:hypothetical protein